MFGIFQFYGESELTDGSNLGSAAEQTGMLLIAGQVNMDDTAKLLLIYTHIYVSLHLCISGQRQWLPH